MIANILTILRIVLTPIIVSTFYVNSKFSNKIAIIIFVIACITDFLDGFAARKLNIRTKFGEFLDPLADKILILITLFFLAGFQRLSIYGLIPASIIIVREILVVGLRSYIENYANSDDSDSKSSIKETLSVNKLSKWKTFLQMISISFLLNNECYCLFIGEVMLWIASILTIVTAYSYIRKVCSCK